MMKKSLVLIAALALAMVACGGEEADSIQQDEIPSVETTADIAETETPELAAAEEDAPVEGLNAEVFALPEDFEEETTDINAENLEAQLSALEAELGAE